MLYNIIYHYWSQTAVGVVFESVSIFLYIASIDKFKLAKSMYVVAPFFHHFFMAQINIKAYHSINLFVHSSLSFCLPIAAAFFLKKSGDHFFPKINKLDNGVKTFMMRHWCFYAPAFSQDTGKYLSEALILASTNPQYDNRLFIELQVQYIKIPSSEHVVYTNCFFVFVLTFRTILCTQHVLDMFWAWNLHVLNS